MEFWEDNGEIRIKKTKGVDGEVGNGDNFR